jgi:hypothetical protein
MDTGKNPEEKIDPTDSEELWANEGSDEVALQESTRWYEFISDGQNWKEYLESVHRIAVDEFLALDSKLKLPQAEKLVKRGWVSRDSKTGSWIAHEKKPPKKVQAIPAILTYRTGEFRAHPALESELFLHPKLTQQNPLQQRGCNARHFVRKLLELKKAAIARGENLQGGNIKTFGTIEGNQAAELGSYHFKLKRALEADVTLVGEPDGEKAPWLNEARAGHRLWNLLEIAMDAGAALERHRLLHRTKAGEAVLKKLTTGAGSPGTPEARAKKLAVERLAAAYFREKKEEATPSKLISWLKAKRTDNNSGRPLKVNHSLWTKELEGLSEDQLHELLKEVMKAGWTRPNLDSTS